MTTLATIILRDPSDYNLELHNRIQAHGIKIVNTMLEIGVLFVHAEPARWGQLEEMPEIIWIGSLRE